MSEIASETLERLKKRADRTAIVYKNGDQEAFIRYEPPIERFEIARKSQIGNIEVEAVDKSSLIGLVAENPIDIKPLTKAFHQIDGKPRAHLWKLVDDRYECVKYVNPQEVSADD